MKIHVASVHEKKIVMTKRVASVHEKKKLFK